MIVQNECGTYPRWPITVMPPGSALTSFAERVVFDLHLTALCPPLPSLPGSPPSRSGTEGCCDVSGSGMSRRLNPMYLVNTSVWVDYIRGWSRPHVRFLRDLLSNPVAVGITPPGAEGKELSRLRFRLMAGGTPTASPLSDQSRLDAVRRRIHGVLAR